jgi:hypothetical protein
MSITFPGILPISAQVQRIMPVALPAYIALHKKVKDAFCSAASILTRFTVLQAGSA